MMSVEHQSNSNRIDVMNPPRANIAMLFLCLVGAAILVLAYILEGKLGDNPMRMVVLTILVSMGIYFMVIGFWAIVFPLAASLAGFGVFLPFWGTTIMLDPTLQDQPDLRNTMVLVILGVGLCLVMCVLVSLTQKLKRLVAGGLSTGVAKYYWRAVLTTVCVLVLIVLGSIRLAIDWGFGGKLTPRFLAVSAMIVAVATLIAMWVCWSQLKHSLRRVGRWWWYPVAICGGLGTALLAGIYTEALRGVVPRELLESMVVFDSSCDWVVLYLWIAVAPAIMEELLFRGVMMGAYRGVMGPGLALMVTSLMFMGLHAMPIVFPVLLVVGLVLGYLRLRSGSVYPCILLHFVHNAVVVTLVLMGE